MFLGSGAIFGGGPTDPGGNDPWAGYVNPHINDVRLRIMVDTVKGDVWTVSAEDFKNMAMASSTIFPLYSWRSAAPDSDIFPLAEMMLKQAIQFGFQHTNTFQSLDGTPIPDELWLAIGKTPPVYSPANPPVDNGGPYYPTDPVYNPTDPIMTPRQMYIDSIKAYISTLQWGTPETDKISTPQLAVQAKLKHWTNQDISDALGGTLSADQIAQLWDKWGVTGYTGSTGTGTGPTPSTSGGAFSPALLAIGAAAAYFLSQ